MGFRPQGSTIDMIFIVPRLRELSSKKDTPLFMRFMHLTKAYRSVDRTLLSTVLARLRGPPRRLSIIRQIHDDMRACVQLDGGG